MPQIHEIKPTINTNERKLRVAAYCRVSSDSDDQLNSFAAQVNHYSKIISGNKTWELADIYADESLTGTRADTRPEFQRLLRDCRKGKIDKILTKSISRFSRNMKDCLTSIRELKLIGVEIFFEKEQLDTGTITSEMLLGFYGTLAQDESVSISGNMRWSYQRRMRSGDFITCRAPYGYRLSGHSLVIDEDEAAIVRRIFEEFLNGKSAKSIAAALSTESITKRHGQWVEKAVRTILQNEKYAGNVLLQKRYTTSSLPFKQVKNNGEKDMFYIENSHPAIISTEVFERAQKLQSQRYFAPSLPQQQYPFSSSIVCNECGQNFTRKTCRGKNYWVCQTHNNNSHACSIRQIPEPFLEAAFVKLWNKLRTHRYDILYPMLRQLESLKILTAKQNKKAYEIDFQLNSLIQQHHMLNLLRTKGYVDAVIFMEKINELNATVTALRQERQRLLNDEYSDSISITKCLLDTLETGPPVLPDFDSARFGSIVDKIIAVSQTEVRFRLLNGLELSETVERIKR